MYSINELAAKAHIELISIAKTMGIARAQHYNAQELIYKILDKQAASPADPEPEGSDPVKPRGRRARIKPTLLAESSNPTQHKHGRKKKSEQTAAAQPLADSKQPSVTIPHPDHVASEVAHLDIAGMEVPQIPNVSDILRVVETGQPSSDSIQRSAAISQPEPRIETKPVEKPIENPEEKPEEKTDERDQKIVDRLHGHVALSVLLDEVDEIFGHIIRDQRFSRAIV